MRGGGYEGKGWDTDVCGSRNPQICTLSPDDLVSMAQVPYLAVLSLGLAGLVSQFGDRTKVVDIPNSVL